jgi:hypothetical protein
VSTETAELTCIVISGKNANDPALPEAAKPAQ